MFRKLYWVTESVDPQGHSNVLGVYTSIPHLISHGIDGFEVEGRLRLTLAKLDSEKEPFGTWCEPDFRGLAEDLREFVETDEFTIEHCQMLAEALKDRTAIAA
ncbi:MAG: hypothetical protein P4L46_22235 [Fimbriimonas sp.]|nr:hypothetical protein [Fimbriimonas sp.]